MQEATHVATVRQLIFEQVAPVRPLQIAPRVGIASCKSELCSVYARLAGHGGAAAHPGAAGVEAVRRERVGLVALATQKTAS